MLVDSSLLRSHGPQYNCFVPSCTVVKYHDCVLGLLPHAVIVHGSNLGIITQKFLNLTLQTRCIS